jgi:hypothetical protein
MIKGGGMKVIFRAVLFFACMMPGLLEAQAVQSAVASELVLRDGSRVYGTVERETNQEVVFRSSAGVVLTVARDQVLSLKVVEGVLIGDRFHVADPNTTRLFFGPTGRALKRGQSYLGMYQFLMPTVQVGVTDRLSIGAGTPLVFAFGDFDDGARPLWLTPKLQVFSGPRTQVSLGAFHVMGIGDQAGIGYVVGTHGDTASSVTAGAGLAYSGGGGRAAVFMLGGERAAKRNIKVVTENYLSPGNMGVLSGGVRFFGERLSADLALAMAFVPEFVGIVPVVNFVYLF